VDDRFRFGLVHGFGFRSHCGQNLQFAGTHCYSLLSFNVGVELGATPRTVAAYPGACDPVRFVVAERIGTIILSALVAHTGWHWMIDRGERLRQFGWPAISSAQLANVMRWLIVILILADWCGSRSRCATGRSAALSAKPPGCDDIFTVRLFAAIGAECGLLPVPNIRIARAEDQLNSRVVRARI